MGSVTILHPPPPPPPPPHPPFESKFHFHGKFWINLINLGLFSFKLLFKKSFALIVNVKNYWMSGKQCRPWSDATFWRIWSGSTLFAQAVCPYTYITKTCLHKFDPFKPHFYMVKLGFTGVYIIFLISAQKHRLWVHVRTALACLGGSHKYPQSMFLSRNMKNIRIFYLKRTYCFDSKFFNIFE